MSSVVHVFNQYYFDLLKKLKTTAKPRRDVDTHAKEIIQGIKKHYMSYDKLAEEYRNEFNTVWTDAMDAYDRLADDETAYAEWVESTESLPLYKDISFKAVMTVLEDPPTCHHYLSIFSILRKDVSDEQVSTVLDIVRTMNDPKVDEKIQAIEDNTIKYLVSRMYSLYLKRLEKVVKGSPIEGLQGIEDTSLGKLAKEILEEVDVTDLQASLGDGDMLKALSNPDGGLVKLLGSVSQKMVAKMASGEIKQETLLEDAMKFAGKLGGSMGPGLEAIGNLAGMFSGAANATNNGGGGFDFNTIANMMSSMGLGGANKPTGGVKTRTNTPAMNQHMRRNIIANQMRRKLDKKKQQAKENVHGDVEDE